MKKTFKKIIMLTKINSWCLFTGMRIGGRKKTALILEDQ
jgi:hypothetical protein